MNGVKMMPNIENPIISSRYHPQDELIETIFISNCTNVKCEEEIYTNDGIEFNGQFYCSCHCIGQHLVNEGQAVDMSLKY